MEYGRGVIPAPGSDSTLEFSPDGSQCEYLQQVQTGRRSRSYRFLQGLLRECRLVIPWDYRISVVP